MTNKNFALLFIGIVAFVILAILFSVNPVHAETNRQLNCNDTRLNISIVKGGPIDKIQYEWQLDTRMENANYIEVVERYFLNNKKIRQFILTYNEEELGGYIGLYWVEELQETDFNVSMEILVAVRTTVGNYNFTCNFPTTALEDLPIIYIGNVTYLPIISK